MAEDIRYQGPDETYTPPIGGGVMFQPSLFQENVDIATSYADKNLLEDLLTQLTATITLLQKDLTDQLQNVSLTITDDVADAQLKAAVAIEWPTILGPPKNVITYSFYTYLENRDSSAAAFIRQQYEGVARDLTGTNAIDIVLLLKAMSQEVSLIQEFLSVHVGELSDSSEKRVVEQLQNWAQSAIDHTSKLRSLVEGTSAQFAQSEMDQLNSSDAINAQALFKVNINQLNSNIQNTLNALEKNFVAFGDVFYKNFLGPSLSFRNQITKNIFPVLPGQIGLEVNQAVSSLDGHFSLILADLVRRTTFFNQKMSDLELLIGVRDNYISYIHQLAAKGMSVAAGGSGTMISARDAASEAAFFANAQDTTVGGSAANNYQYLSPHNALGGLTDPAAHSQYYPLSGGTLTGNMQLKSGVKVDGMIPHLHAHAGPTVDGTEQISGQDIAPGTLTSNLINKAADTPVTPTNLRLVGITKQVDTSSGMNQISYTATFAWDGDPGSQYELQLTPLG